MSKELNLKSAFKDALNFIDKIVGEYVCDYQPILSKHEDRDGHLISIRANCRHKHCKHVVMASISTTEESWSKKLVDTFIMRAEFHAKKAHQIKAEWYRLPHYVDRRGS
jgi:hypothetical protein